MRHLLVSRQVGECLGTFWRPSFDLAMFPYLPAHCTRPKEVRKLFLVPLPEKCYFAVRPMRVRLCMLLKHVHAYDGCKVGSAVIKPMHVTCPSWGNDSCLSCGG